MTDNVFSPSAARRVRVSLALFCMLFLALGLWAIRLQAQQARDTVRKHDIEDLEQALLAHARVSGTYPPDDLAVWCGTLSAPAHASVHTAVETALRTMEKYTNAEKPFPADPVFAGTARDYFYWKTSPVSFELLSELEADPNNTRDTHPCGGTIAYDYGIVSTQRTAF